MTVQGSPELGYLATAGYVLRRRERFWLGTIIFVSAFPGSLLTLATIGYLHGYPSVAEVIYFGLFFLLAVPVGIDMWKDRAAVAGQVLLAVDEGGVYLADPPRRIPWGEVASYGGVARAIGRPGAARAVGAAVGRNPIGLVVPCHRVIAGDGSLGGYGGSWFGEASALRDVKRQLLALEGTVPAGGHVAWTTFGAPDG